MLNMLCLWPKLPPTQKELVLALSSSPSLISAVTARPAPISPGGTQAWSCFHGDETAPGLGFHFILYLNDIIKKLHQWECQPSEGGRLSKGRATDLLGPYLSEELLWEFVFNKGVWVVILQRRSQRPHRDNGLGPVVSKASDISSCLG